jgi:hypothetical protein
MYRIEKEQYGKKQVEEIIETKEGFSQWTLAHRALRQSRECLDRAVTIVCRPQRRGAGTRSCGVWSGSGPKEVVLSATEVLALATLFLATTFAQAEWKEFTFPGGNSGVVIPNSPQRLKGQLVSSKYMRSSSDSTSGQIVRPCKTSTERTLRLPDRARALPVREGDAGAIAAWKQLRNCRQLGAGLAKYLGNGCFRPERDCPKRTRIPVAQTAFILRRLFLSS